MFALTTPDLVTLWDRLEKRPSGERAKILLCLAHPKTVADDLDKCVVSQRDSDLFTLYSMLFGNTIDAVVTCSNCEQRMEISVALGDIVPPSSPAIPAAAICQVGEYEVTVRALQTGDLCNLPSDLESAIAIAAERCILGATIGGQQIILRDLPPDVVDIIADACETLDPSADIRLSFECIGCDGVMVTAFDITWFLTDSVRRFASSALLDVHSLASAYGWTESEIFALSDTRRRQYVALASA